MRLSVYSSVFGVQMSAYLLGILATTATSALADAPTYDPPAYTILADGDESDEPDDQLTPPERMKEPDTADDEELEKLQAWAKDFLKRLQVMPGSSQPAGDSSRPNEIDQRRPDQTSLVGRLELAFGISPWVEFGETDDGVQVRSGGVSLRLNDRVTLDGGLYRDITGHSEDAEPYPGARVTFRF